MNPVMPRPHRRLLRMEIDPAARTEFSLAPHHASRNARHIRNLGTAQPERIAHAGLLLLHGVGPSGRGPRPRDDGRDHTELFHSNRESTHVSPKPPPRGIVIERIKVCKQAFALCFSYRWKVLLRAYIATTTRTRVPTSGSDPRKNTVCNDAVKRIKSSARRPAGAAPCAPDRFSFACSRLSNSLHPAEMRHVATRVLSNAANHSGQAINDHANFRQTLNRLFGAVGSEKPPGGASVLFNADRVATSRQLPSPRRTIGLIDAAETCRLKGSRRQAATIWPKRRYGWVGAASAPSYH